MMRVVRPMIFVLGLALLGLAVFAAKSEVFGQQCGTPELVTEILSDSIPGLYEHDRIDGAELAALLELIGAEPGAADLVIAYKHNDAVHPEAGPMLLIAVFKDGCLMAEPTEIPQAVYDRDTALARQRAAA